MHDSIKQALFDLQKLPNTNKEDILDCLNFLEHNQHLTKPENPLDHFCSMIVPYDKEANKVFVGHHIKADDWIPPGGHIDYPEAPLKTVRREIQEELQHTVTDEKIELFDICIKHITNPKSPCKTHRDFWYILYMKEKPFTVDPKEFYDSSWLPLDEALQRMKTPVFHHVLAKLRRSS